MRDPEYDRFGPWVIEISEEDPPPPLFVPYLTRAEEPLLSVKIPRKIERRVAHAGMNLYDYMVTLYENDLVILQRVGENAVQQQTFSYSDIEFLRHGENLLKGSLYLGTAGEGYDLPFNTTSKDIMRRLRDLLRERYTTEESVAIPAVEADIPAGELSFYFKRLLEHARAQHPQRRLLASQPDMLIGSYETGAWRKVLFGAISKTLLESLHHCDGRELMITSRSKMFKYRWQTEYGTQYTYIPVSNISSVFWQEDAQNEGVRTLNLSTAGETVSFAFFRDNPWISTYDRFLKSANWKLETEN